MQKMSYRILLVLVTACACEVPVATAQDGENDIATVSQAFNAAWLARDANAARKYLAADARFFSANGGDLSDIYGTMWHMNRSLKNAKSVETIIDREVKTFGTTTIVTQTARVDHRVGERDTSSAQRQTQIWTRKDDAWKLAHLHVSPYSRFEKDIAAFEKADRASAPKPGGVVFVGSSSIRMWKSLKDDFPGTATVHRGFGGSQMVDTIMYAHRIITPYRPRKVVVYEGDNDMNAGKGPAHVLRNFKTLVQTIHSRVPDAEIGFIAIKPSRARWKLWPEMDKANKMIADFAAKHPKVTYFDIATPMLGENDTIPSPDWFIKDGLHMKPKGYELWTRIVKPWVDAD